MSDPLADIDMLAAWHGMPPFDSGSADELRAGAVIAMISDLARGEARQSDWTMETAPAEVCAIVLMVAAEAFENGGKTSITVEEVTRRWERGELFTADQKATLQSHRPGSSSGLSTVQFTRGLASMKPVTAPVFDGGKPVTLYDGRGF